MRPRELGQYDSLFGCILNEKESKRKQIVCLHRTDIVMLIRTALVHPNKGLDTNIFTSNLCSCLVLGESENVIVLHCCLLRMLRLSSLFSSCTDILECCPLQQKEGNIDCFLLTRDAEQESKTCRHVQWETWIVVSLWEWPRQLLYLTVCKLKNACFEFWLKIWKKALLWCLLSHKTLSYCPPG